MSDASSRKSFSADLSSDWEESSLHRPSPVLVGNATAAEANPTEDVPISKADLKEAVFEAYKLGGIQMMQLLQGQIDNLRREKQEKEEELERLKAVFMSTKEESEKKQTKIKSLEQEIVTINEKLFQRQKEYDDAKIELHEGNKHAQALQKQNKLLEGELQTAKGKLKEANQKISHLEEDRENDKKMYNKNIRDVSQKLAQKRVSKKVKK